MNTFESMPNIEPDRIRVAVGLVLDSQRRVLIGCRTAPDQYFGKWEFPGGKIQNGESVSDALKRELNEEIGILVISSTHFDSFNYDYPDRKVMLNFRLVEHYSGEPDSLEQQDLRWVEINDLGGFDMLAPNIRIIEQLKKLNRQGTDGEISI